MLDVLDTNDRACISLLERERAIDCVTVDTTTIREQTATAQSEIHNALIAVLELPELCLYLW